MSRALPWIIALLISLVANGVMTGLVLHRVVGAPTVEQVFPHEGHPPPRREGPEQGGFHIRAFLRNLPDEQREIARQRFEEERATIRQLMLDVRDAQRAAEDAMSAIPYDPEVAEAALDELRQRRFAIESAFEAIVLDVIADLPPEERLRALQAGRQGPPPHHRRRPPPPPRDRDY